MPQNRKSDNHLGKSYRNPEVVKENGKLYHPGLLYEPSMCDRLLELMAQGWTYVEVAKELKTSLTTMRRWCDEFPEFAAAYKLGFEYAEAWYQKLGRGFLVTDPSRSKANLNDKMWIYKMKSRFKQYDNAPPININLGVDTAQIDEIKTIMEEEVKKLHNSTI